jgi:preprotein translocase subunit SecB
MSALTKKGKKFRRFFPFCHYAADSKGIFSARNIKAPLMSVTTFFNCAAKVILFPQIKTFFWKRIAIGAFPAKKKL